MWSVHKKPRVALLSSGDELLDVNAPLEAGKIRDSNSYTLASAIEDEGADVYASAWQRIRAKPSPPSSTAP
jgi:molybdopterin biosynthesis enzyme